MAQYVFLTWIPVDTVSRLPYGEGLPYRPKKRCFTRMPDFIAPVRPRIYKY